VWEVPAENTALSKKIRKGTATLANLTAGGVQRGIGATDDYPCSDNGNDCDDIYAVSIPGVKPSVNITWFQAQQACMNAGKRLLTNGEWQGAAAGTPDPGTDNDSTDCNITNQGFPANDPVNTGSHSGCVSRWGAFDMVGNVWEWVADWIQDNSDSDGGVTSSATYGSDAIFGVDEAFPETDRFPAALIRGAASTAARALESLP
jgi:formylglycine-generating enzyme required for sulfatase activity